MHTFAPFLAVLAAIIVLTAFLRAGLRRAGPPPLVAFLLIGLALTAADARWALFDPVHEEVLAFLGKMGVIVLLFRVGLESDVPGLLRQLRSAGLIWIGNVVASFALGYLCARHVLDFDLIPSIFLGTALTATSLGVTVPIWRRQKKLSSRPGELLVDVAELDDISGVVLMALLFGVAPALHSGDGESTALLGSVFAQGGWLLTKLLLFGAACLGFSRFLEPHVTGFARRIESEASCMLTIVAVGIFTAAIAGCLGFSVAIGAFFGGLAFSRDPQATHLEPVFLPLYHLFAPFFFIHIGYRLAPDALVGGLALGSVLALAAAGGKLLGALPPAAWVGGGATALLVGLSLIPRAEIAMVILGHGRRLGDWATPPEAFAAGCVVVALTCILTPLILRPAIRRLA
ncbi:MAG: cation:proton antiporter [Planctomycetota bacterium]